MLKIVCISDTHLKMNHIKLPDGDLLIHAGDHTSTGSIQQMSQAFKDLAKHKYKYGIVTICGNHDWLGELDPLLTKQLAKDNGLIYLDDSFVEINGYKIWGSPVQPEFCNWAFNRERGHVIRQHWDKIHNDVNILVTHGPPANILDQCPDHYDRLGEKVGCSDLVNAIQRLKPNLQLHVFGHIHNSYGMRCEDGVTYVNASCCDERYIPINAPIIVDLD